MTKLALETRKQTQVDNDHNPDMVLYGDQLAANELKSKYLASLHRPTPVCYTYNCHGLTFAGRRTQITSSAVVRAILNDDDYVEVEFKETMAGDIVIYVSKFGDIEHSGVVVRYYPSNLPSDVMIA